MLSKIEKYLDTTYLEVKKGSENVTKSTRIVLIPYVLVTTVSSDRINYLYAKYYFFVTSRGVQFALDSW